MKNLKKLTLAALALAIVPAVHAQTVTVFDSNTTSWTQQADGSVAPAGTLAASAVGDVTSTTAGGVTTFSSPDFTNGPVNGVSASGAEGADFFTIPGGITTGSGTWTLSTTLSFTGGLGTGGITGNFIDAAIGFGTFSSNVQQINANGVFPNQSTGPVIGDSRLVKIDGGEFPGGSAAPHSGVGSNPQEGSTFSITSPLADGGDTNIKLQIVLNTNGPEWTEEFLDNGVPESFMLNGVATDTITIDPTTITGFAESLAAGASASSVTFADTTLTDTIVAAPEPSTYALLFGGLGLLVFIQRLRKNSVRA